MRFLLFFATIEVKVCKEKLRVVNPFGALELISKYLKHNDPRNRATFKTFFIKFITSPLPLINQAHSDIMPPPPPKCKQMRECHTFFYLLCSEQHIGLFIKRILTTFMQLLLYFWKANHIAILCLVKKNHYAHDSNLENQSVDKL